MPYVEVNGLSKTYATPRGPLQVLCELDLTIETGEMVAVVGASGVGKSTLLHVLGGLDPIDAGVIRIGGVDISVLSDAERVRFRHTQVGFVFQFHHLLPRVHRDRKRRDAAAHRTPHPG